MSGDDRSRAERQTQPNSAAGKILLIDRDGTINSRPPNGGYLTGWDDFVWLEDNVEAMQLLAKGGFRFIVISNQAGIGRGIVARATVDDINRKMVADLSERGIDIVDVYICPHHPDDNCDCRKPAPGMFHRAAREHSFQIDRSVYIGDDPRDAVAAHNAGCPSVLIGPERDVDPGSGVTATFTSATLLGALTWINQLFDIWDKGDADTLAKTIRRSRSGVRSSTNCSPNRAG